MDNRKRIQLTISVFPSFPFVCVCVCWQIDSSFRSVAVAWQQALSTGVTAAAASNHRQVALSLKLHWQLLRVVKNIQMREAQLGKRKSSEARENQFGFLF